MLVVEVLDVLLGYLNHTLPIVSLGTLEAIAQGFKGCRLTFQAMSQDELLCVPVALDSDPLSTVPDVLVCAHRYLLNRLQYTPLGQ